MIKDSGERRTFDTGAQRDRQVGKGRMDLLPYRALIEVSKLFEEGAVKYASRNWEKGMPVKEFLDSGARHHAKCMIGLDDEPHLVQWCWNSLCALDTYLRIQDGTLPADLMEGLPFDSFLLMGEEPGAPVEPMEQQTSGPRFNWETPPETADIDCTINWSFGPVEQCTDGLSVMFDEYIKPKVGTWWKAKALGTVEVACVNSDSVFFYALSRNRLESTSLGCWCRNVLAKLLTPTRMPLHVRIQRWWDSTKRTTA